MVNGPSQTSHHQNVAFTFSGRDQMIPMKTVHRSIKVNYAHQAKTLETVCQQLTALHWIKKDQEIELTEQKQQNTLVASSVNVV